MLVGLTTFLLLDMVQNTNLRKILTGKFYMVSVSTKKDRTMIPGLTKDLQMAMEMVVKDLVLKTVLPFVEKQDNVLVSNTPNMKTDVF
jgi:hypothetical protein